MVTWWLFEPLSCYLWTKIAFFHYFPFQATIHGMMPLKKDVRLAQLWLQSTQICLATLVFILLIPYFLIQFPPLNSFCSKRSVLFRYKIEICGNYLFKFSTILILQPSFGMALFQYFWSFTQIWKKFAVYECKFVFVTVRAPKIVQKQ